MRLPAGTHLGPYEILASIGVGGMGEVYTARDTRLHRTVAVKVSADQFSERFEREARAVAALNHPHICTLHDIGPNYLVMEFIDGQALKGPLPLPQALKYAAQICDALDAAHKRGIVHRDLKPANILVTKSGVKLLDFGLAKMKTSRPTDGNTETIALTQANTILGTLQYMAPEQLEGKDADARSDIFAFGAVLYEMLTGKQPFEGKTQASLIAAILERDPPSIADAVPTALDRLMRRCLEKDPEQRWESARDLKAELEWIAEGGAAPVPPAATSKRSNWQKHTVWIAALIVLIALAVWYRPALPPARELVRFSIFPPDKTTFSIATNMTIPAPQFELSPDGHAIVFAAALPGAKPMLWLRPLAELSAHTIAGTEGAEYPFWSPDGQWIAFFSDNKLKRIPASGGPAQNIAEGLTDPRGLSWGPDNTILFALGASNISRVPFSGGAITPVTRIDTTLKEGAHRWPRFLPDGRHFLYSIQGELVERRGVYAGSLDGQTKKLLIHYNLFGSASYSPPGYLLFLNGDTLMAQSFDAERLELREQPLRVAEHVGRSSGGQIAVSVSRTGTMAYADGMFRLGRLTWFDRNGNRLDSVPGPEGDYSDFRLSPDEQRIAFSLADDKTGIPDIRLVDQVRGGISRFTLGPGLNASPVWSPDGTRILFRSNRRGVIEMWQKSTAGSGEEDPTVPLETERAAGVSVTTSLPTDWSPDGRYLLCAMAGLGTGFDLWVAPLAGDKKLVKFLGSPYDEMHGSFSPDGKLVTYGSNESGKFEVYVETFPRSERRWQVSTNGGSEPRWRRDQQEIYYLSEDRKLMAVAVGRGSTFGIPKMLFQTRAPAGVNAFRTNYVPSNDGKRFLVNTQIDQPPTPIAVVLNWTAGLKK
jgi:serine/threonine protein kinase/Tol biopolymer transport system component